jgi:hypothetical protein
MIEYLFLNGFSSNNNLYKNIKRYAYVHELKIHFINWNKEINKLNNIRDLYKIDNNSRYILIAHSWGCQIAFKFYNYYYKNIDKIILIDYHPLYNILDDTINKKDLVAGFFPKCSCYKKNSYNKVYKSIRLKNIRIISEKIRYNKRLNDKLIRLINKNNTKIYFIYSTGINLDKKRNIVHMCVNSKNRKKIINSSKLFIKQKLKKIKILYRSSHYWFLDSSKNINIIFSK